MRFGTTADPRQVDAMAHVVSCYCRHLGIERDTPEAEHIASVVLALHEAGVRGESELLKALIAPTGRLPLQPSTRVARRAPDRERPRPGSKPTAAA